MDTYQMSQVIQLMLNSALMIVACALLWLGLVYTRPSHLARIRQTYHRYRQALQQPHIPRFYVGRLKYELRFAKRIYWGVKAGRFCFSSAILLFSGSIIILALSALTAQAWMVKPSLTLFLFGTGLLVSGILMGAIANSLPLLLAAQQRKRQELASQMMLYQYQPAHVYQPLVPPHKSLLLAVERNRIQMPQRRSSSVPVTRSKPVTQHLLPPSQALKTAFQRDYYPHVQRIHAMRPMPKDKV